MNREKSLMHCELPATHSREQKALHKVVIVYAIYLLFQAAENIILAILTSEAQDVGRPEQHRLELYVAKIPDSNPLKPRCKDIANLAKYATSYRYTTTEGNIPEAPSANFVTDKINKISSLLTETAKRFQVDLDKKTLPRANQIRFVKTWIPIRHGRLRMVGTSGKRQIRSEWHHGAARRIRSPY